MSFTILTDGNADLTPACIAQFGLEILPMAFILDGTQYTHHMDQREMPIHDFYDALRGGKEVSTVAANPTQWAEKMTELVEKGQDLLVLPFSSGLSATYNAARLAAEEVLESFPDRSIQVVDSLCASTGQGLYCYMVSEKAKSGASLEETAQYAEDIRLKMIHWFTVDDLQFLKRGGRISGTAAALGTMLQVKPVLRVDDEGKLTSHSKARGRKGALNALVAKMAETAIEPEKYPVFISHGDSLADAQYVKTKIMETYNVPAVYISEIGPPIGAHSGPGTIAVFYYGTNR